jgi:hypothetical protein
MAAASGLIHCIGPLGQAGNQEQARTVKEQARALTARSAIGLSPK